MYGHFFQDGIELFEFQSFRIVLLVLNGYIPAGTGLSAGLVLGALQNNLNAIAFLRHDAYFLELDFFALGPQFFHYGVQTSLVDGPDGISRYLKGHPLILFSQEELLGLQVGQETTLGLDVGVRDLVPPDWGLSGNLTYACHND